MTTETPPKPAREFRVALDDTPTAQLVADHYQKTYELLHEFWKERNKLFLLLLAVAGVASLLMIQPEGILSITCNVYKNFIPAAVNNCADTTSFAREFPFRLLHTILLIGILYLMMQIYHQTVSIRNMYAYCAKLETDIRSLTGLPERMTVTFTREGTFYETNQTLVQKSTGVAFALLLGALLLLVLAGRLLTFKSLFIPGTTAEEVKFGVYILTAIDALTLLVTAAFYLAYMLPIAEAYFRLIGSRLEARRKALDGRAPKSRRAAAAFVGAGVLFGFLFLVVNYFLERGMDAPRWGVSGSLALMLSYLVMFLVGGALAAGPFAEVFAPAAAQPPPKEADTTDDATPEDRRPQPQS